MNTVYINEIVTAVPPFDIHAPFITFANTIIENIGERTILNKAIRRSQIDHRYSFLTPTCFENGGFYSPGRFADTGARMQFFEQNAIKLAVAALAQLDLDRIRTKVTHLIVTCCTGFYAPGVDIDIVSWFGLNPSVERTVIGFMGCSAGISALKFARHVVRSEPKATVLVVNIELCTLHLQERDDLEQMLCFSLWGDGCAASLVSAEARGIELKSFHSTTIEDSAEQMGWRIGGSGFDMILSGTSPADPGVGAAVQGRRIARRPQQGRDRPLGGASGRPLHPRRHCERTGAHRGRTGCFARHSAAVRQYVVGDGPIRAEDPARPTIARAGLRDGLRSGADGREHGVRSYRLNTKTATAMIGRAFETGPSFRQQLPTLYSEVEWQREQSRWMVTARATAYLVYGAAANVLFAFAALYGIAFIGNVAAPKTVEFWARCSMASGRSRRHPVDPGVCNPA